MGSTLFVGCAIGKVTLEEVSRQLWPFWIVMVIVLILVTYVPPFAMTIPSWVKF